MKGPKQRPILVIGGAGYIGSVLTRELLAAGHPVSVLDSLLYGNGGSLSAVAEHAGFSFARGDVRSPEDLRSALDGMPLFPSITEEQVGLVVGKLAAAL